MLASETPRAFATCSTVRRGVTSRRSFSCPEIRMFRSLIYLSIKVNVPLSERFDKNRHGHVAFMLTGFNSRRTVYPMTSKQAAAYRQQRVVTTSAAALALRSHFGVCADCKQEGLLGEWELCRSCAMDAEYSMSGEANPPAAPDTTPAPRCAACGDDGCDLDSLERCYDCRPRSADDAADARQEVGLDDWKGDEGR